jgi:hypothetical protein
MYMLSCGRHTTIFIITLLHLILENLLAKFLVTCTCKNNLTTWLCLVEGNLASLHDLVSFKIEHLKGSRMRRINKENVIDRPSLELVQLLSFLKDKTFAAKDKKVTHLGGSTMHQLVATFLFMDTGVNPIRHIARFIDCLSPEPSQSLMLIEHHSSHLAQGSVFPFHHAVMGRHIRTRELVFKTQVMAKCFEARVFKFRAIVTADRSYGISVPLVSQPQDKISNKTKHLPFLLRKENPRIPRVVIHHNQNVPLPTHGSHTSWANKVHMEQLALTLRHHIGAGWMGRGYHLSMPTRRTNQLFLKPQSWQSLDQIVFTQARQKGQSLSDPTSYATSTTHSKN